LRALYNTSYLFIHPLDTAYQQKIERLHRGLKAVSELEVTIKDEATVYRGLLKELHMNAMREESTVHVFSKILQGVVTQTEEHLIDAIKRYTYI
jgi:dUTPase